eukprot:03608.XXX_171711_163215_1 [CDS] Oithona nana genome sequencing.
MSAIKEFFKKKKTDAKFKLAGSGQKLGDNASSSGQSSRPTSSRAAAASSSSSNQGAKSNRGALSHEQRLAASAALQSNAPSNADDFEKRRSQAAIRAQALKELEREEQAASAAEKLRDTYGEKPLIECEIAPSGGSSTVLYKCPLIGDQVLPKEEMRQAIKDFLYSQIEAEPGLTACLIIHTLNTDTEKVKICVDTLCKYLDNIMQNPTQEKFRKIRQSNKAYQERIAVLEGTELFMQSAGFMSQIVDEQEFWVFAEESDLEGLQVLKEALLGAEPIRAELDRNIKVLMPRQAQTPISLPTDFFNLSPEELKREQQLKSELAERETMLRTKAMREREEMKERRKYRFCLIRVRFPDGLVLQGTFGVYEKFQSVEDFVSECLEHPLPFILHDAASGQAMDQECKENSLMELALVPTSILSFAWHPEVAEEVKSQLGSNAVYLRDDITALITE